MRGDSQLHGELRIIIVSSPVSESVCLMPVSAPTVLPPVTDPSTAWLVVDDIALRYGKRTILEHLSFALPQGGIACLLGPSGCGKTTALRAIAGFEPISDGAIRLAGQVLSAPGQITPPASAWCFRTTRCSRT
jgi:ABC-type multidrug transport system fused ATPase/permease subunit